MLQPDIDTVQIERNLAVAALDLSMFDADDRVSVVPQRPDASFVPIDLEARNWRHSGFQSVAAAYSNLAKSRRILDANGMAPDRITQLNQAAQPLGHDGIVDRTWRFLCGVLSRSGRPRRRHRGRSSRAHGRDTVRRPARDQRAANTAKGARRCLVRKKPA